MNCARVHENPDILNDGEGQEIAKTATVDLIKKLKLRDFEALWLRDHPMSSHVRHLRSGFPL